MTKLAVPLSEARAAAQDVIERIDGTYDRIEIAGSIRRGKPTVGDIELVCVPKEWPAESDLWGAPVPVNAVAQTLHRGILKGWLRPADKPAAGDRYARVVHAASGLQVDCFMVTGSRQWGVLLLIRTGPVDYSKWLVQEAKRRGFHVAHGGLHIGGLGHADPDACTCQTILTPEERDVYEVLGLPFEEPSRRGEVAA